MALERCRGGPHTREDRGRIAVTASASRPPRNPSELAFAYANPSAGSNQHYVHHLSPDLSGEQALVFRFSGGSSVSEELGKVSIGGQEEEVRADCHGLVSLRGGSSVLEGNWALDWGRHCLRFGAGLGWEERLGAPLSLLPGLGRPVSAGGDGSVAAGGVPGVGFGEGGVLCGGSFSALPETGGFSEETIAPVMEVSCFAGVAPLGATPDFFGQYKLEMRRRMKMEEMNILIFDWALYARVSDSGGGEGTPLVTQAEEIVKRTEELGLFPEPKFCFIEEWNGFELDRPQLIELRRKVEAGEVRVVVAHSPEVLAERPLDRLKLGLELDEAGARLRFVRGPLRGVPCTGMDLCFPDCAVFFGYDRDPASKEWVANEEEAALVGFLFQRAAEGWTPRRLAKLLNDAGCLTKRGFRWTGAGIAGLLANPGYVGVQYYGGTREGDSASGPAPQAIRIEGLSSPIITNELFDSVQARVKERKAKPRISPAGFLLSGLARCLDCGAPMTGYGHRWGWRYYLCSRTVPTASGPASCNARIVCADWLEETVWSKFSAAVSEPNLLKAGLRLFVQDNEGAMWAKIAEKKEKIGGLLELWKRAGVELGLVSGFPAGLKRSGNDMECLLLFLEEQQLSGEDPEQIWGGILELSEAISVCLSGLTGGGKWAVLRAFGVKIEANREDVIVNLNLDPGP